MESSVKTTRLACEVLGVGGQGTVYLCHKRSRFLEGGETPGCWRSCIQNSDRLCQLLVLEDEDLFFQNGWVPYFDRMN